MSDHTWMDEGAESIPSMVRRHEKDLYRGNGKPALTVRMTQQEDATEAMESRMETIDRKFWAIILLLITLLGGVIGDIVTHHGEEQGQTKSLLY